VGREDQRQTKNARRQCGIYTPERERTEEGKQKRAPTSKAVAVAFLTFSEFKLLLL
jgi:hypothetical protein